MTGLDSLNQHVTRSNPRCTKCERERSYNFMETNETPEEVFLAWLDALLKEPASKTYVSICQCGWHTYLVAKVDERSFVVFRG